MNEDYDKLIKVKCDIAEEAINLLIERKFFKKSELIVYDKTTKETRYTNLGQTIFDLWYDTLERYFSNKDENK